MVGRNVGLSVRGISGQTDGYRAQRDRYKLFHPASALWQCKVLQATAFRHGRPCGLGAVRKAIGRVFPQGITGLMRERKATEKLGKAVKHSPAKRSPERVKCQSVQPLGFPRNEGDLRPLSARGPGHNA